jgi:hypothetical protein
VTDDGGLAGIARGVRAAMARDGRMHSRLWSSRSSAVSRESRPYERRNQRGIRRSFRCGSAIPRSFPKTGAARTLSAAASISDRGLVVTDRIKNRVERRLARVVVVHRVSLVLL